MKNNILILLLLGLIPNCTNYMVYNGIGLSINKELLKNNNETEESLFLFSVKVESSLYNRSHFAKKSNTSIFSSGLPWWTDKTYSCNKYKISIQDSTKAKIDSLEYFTLSDLHGAVIHYTFIDTDKSFIIARKSKNKIDFITPINIYKDSITIDYTNYPIWKKKKIFEFFKLLFPPMYD